MKKLFSVILIISISFTLVSCSSKINSPKHLTKTGIAPYKLSKSEKYILQSFKMENNSQIISFKAPKEAITLKINVYQLNNKNNWDKNSSGAISIGTDREPIDDLIGTFTMQLKENYIIDYNINCAGVGSFKTEKIILENEPKISSKIFLKDFEKIEINKEIPVALMVYNSESSMKTYCLQDYFEPSKFNESNLVQAVTLSFSDKE